MPKSCFEGAGKESPSYMVKRGGDLAVFEEDAKVFRTQGL